MSSVGFPHSAPLRPEAELLLLCVRPKRTPRQMERIYTLVQPELEWSWLIPTAQTHQVTPLLLDGLLEARSTSTPPVVQSLLKQWQAGHAWRALYLTQTLLKLLRLLSAHAIPAIPYKGPALAVFLYGQPSRRRFEDLDIIVRPQDAATAREILINEAQFALTWPPQPLTAQQEATHLRTKYNYELVRPTDNVVLELHWNITPSYLSIPPDPSQLWQRLDAVSLGGQLLPCFPAEELLLILCTHGANHCWIRLNWICDLAQLLHSYPIDWERVQRLARAWHCQRLLRMGLLLAQELLGTELPTTIEQYIWSDREAVALATQSVTRYRFDDNRWLSPFEEPLFHLRMRERARDKVRYLQEMSTPTAKDRQRLPLPGKLHFLYYLSRPLRLMWEHGAKLYGHSSWKRHKRRGSGI